MLELIRGRIACNDCDFCIAGLPTKPITNDDYDRLLFVLRVLELKTPIVVDIFTKHCKNALSAMLTAKADEEALSNKVNAAANGIEWKVVGVELTTYDFAGKRKSRRESARRRLDHVHATVEPASVGIRNDRKRFRAKSKPSGCRKCDKYGGQTEHSIDE